MDYKEKLEEAKKLYESANDDQKYIIEKLFPELNKDEQIRKAIIEFFELQDDDTTYSFIPKKDILTWLEKQQKSTWSEKDEKILDDIIEEVYPLGECPDYPTDEEREYYYGHSKMIDWLKALKQRIER